MHVCERHDTNIWLPPEYGLPIAPAVRAHVNNGALVLDQVWPNWIENINLDKLSIVDPFDCILGQLYGMYTVGIAKLGVYGYNDLGFTMSNESGFNADFVTGMWRELIEMRRNADNG